MKEYIVVWKCNKFGSDVKLEDDYRKLNESRFNCYHLADLFNELNAFLEKFKDFFPEVISISEI